MIRIAGLVIAMGVWLPPARADVARVVSQPSVAATDELGLDTHVGGLVSDYTYGAFADVTLWIDWRVAGWLKAGAEAGAGIAGLKIDEGGDASGGYVRTTSAWLRALHRWERGGMTWRAGLGAVISAPALWAAGVENEPVFLLVLPESTVASPDGSLGPTAQLDASVRLDADGTFGQLTAAVATISDGTGGTWAVEHFSVGAGWHLGHDWSFATALHAGTYRYLQGGAFTGLEVGAEARSGLAFAIYIPLQERRGAGGMVVLGYHRVAKRR